MIFSYNNERLIALIRTNTSGKERKSALVTSRLTYYIFLIDGVDFNMMHILILVDAITDLMKNVDTDLMKNK